MKRCTVLAAVLGLVGALALADPTPAFAISAPTAVQAEFDSCCHLLFSQWHAVRGASYYEVWVSKDGYDGPWLESKVKGKTSIYIDYSWFPYQDSQGAYRLNVEAVDRHGNGAVSSKAFQANMRGSGVNTSNASSSASKANGCLHKGLAAGVTTAASGGIVKTLAMWIPGVQDVTVATIGAASAGAGVTTFVACLL